MMSDSVNQPTAAPTRKVTIGAAIGALVTIVVWLVDVASDQEVPALVAAALVVVLAFAASYITPNVNVAEPEEAV